MNPIELNQMFYAASRELPVQPFMRTLEPFLPNPGRALDFGAGLGKEAAWLIARGWRVTAVECDVTALDDLRHNAPAAEVVLDLADVKGEYDLTLACFSIFYPAPESLADTWRRLLALTKPGGILAGQLLGEQDSWANWARTAHRDEVEALYDGHERLYHEEVCREGKTAFGATKTWHVHHFVLRTSKTR